MFKPKAERIQIWLKGLETLEGVSRSRWIRTSGDARRNRGVNTAPLARLIFTERHLRHRPGERPAGTDSKRIGPGWFDTTSVARPHVRIVL